MTDILPRSSEPPRNFKSNSPKSPPSLYENQESHTEPDNGSGGMREEANRLKSFQQKWPHSFINPIEIAKAGFYFIKPIDFVRCAFCSLEIEDWQPGDDPMQCHADFSPECPFVKQHNISVTVGHDTCGKYGIEVRPNSVPENEPCSSSSSNKLNYSTLGIQTTRGPSYPSYAQYETRLNSFSLWPKSMKQKPTDLAAAGFYYTGRGDQTICFHCGGGLKDWEDNDDPWEQHAAWFRKCNFLILQKGAQYITDVFNKKQTTLMSDVEELNAAAATTSSTKETQSTTNQSPTNINLSTAKSENNETKTKESTEDNGKTTGNTLCKICYAKEVGVVFLPCGHIVACIDCAPALSSCAICRKPVEATVRAFLS